SLPRLTATPSFLFFLIIRRPPRSTLFPTRRSSDLSHEFIESGLRPAWGAQRICWHVRHPESMVLTARSDRSIAGFAIMRYAEERSEEHTSELQSLTNLVCRLLLEKKNTHAHPRIST